MCFRPAITETPFECPECGKRINPIMGQLPNTCPFCEKDISEEAAKAMALSIGAPPESSLAKPMAPKGQQSARAPFSPSRVPSAPKTPAASDKPSTPKEG